MSDLCAALADNLNPEIEMAVRLRCLEMSLNSPSQRTGSVIEYARIMADFVLGTNDAEIIRAAHELYAKVKTTQS